MDAIHVGPLSDERLAKITSDHAEIGTHTVAAGSQVHRLWNYTRDLLGEVGYQRRRADELERELSTIKSEVVEYVHDGLDFDAD